MQIGFVGVGTMGLRMARRLMQAGSRITVFDTDPRPVAELASEGATAATSAAELATTCDIVFSMLPTGRDVEDLYLGDGAVLAHARPGTLLIDCSTISGPVAGALAASVAEHGCQMLDAPVSGGTGGAEAATLTFMVGGPADALERARPILMQMGQTIIHVGGNGAGQIAKACNNMLCGIAMIGTVEALALGVRNGLDPKVLSEIMRVSSGTTYALQKHNPFPGIMDHAPASNGYAGGFRSELQLKDMRLALELAAESGSPVTVASVCANLFAIHCNAGNAGKDYSSIMEMMLPQVPD